MTNDGVKPSLSRPRSPARTRSLNWQPKCNGQDVEAVMNNLFAQDIFIRLAEDNSGFVCTIRCGRLSSKVEEFTLEEPAMPQRPGMPQSPGIPQSTEDTLAVLLKRPFRQGHFEAGDPGHRRE